VTEYYTMISMYSLVRGQTALWSCPKLLPSMLNRVWPCKTKHESAVSRTLASFPGMSLSVSNAYMGKIDVPILIVPNHHPED